MRRNIVPYRIPQPNNMGMVRYVLALSVVIAHFCELSGFPNYWPITSYNAVGGFFALSGFLMAGNYLKSPGWKAYILRRCRRILPAYWLVVLFFAVALFPFSAVSDYFLQPGFWKYLGANLTMLNFLHPELPGVFASNPAHAVNGSLWTMKVEMFLYLTIPLTIPLLKRYPKHTALIFLTIFIVSAAYRVGFLRLYEIYDSEIFKILSRQFVGQLMYFYMGAFLYYYYDEFMRRKWAVAIVSLLAIVAMRCMLELPVESSVPYMTYTVLTPVFVSPLVIFASMVGRWGTWEGKHDNVSYNVYLIHFPVVQLAIASGISTLWGGWGGFAIVLAVTFLLAAASGYVEKWVWRVLWRA